MQYHTPSPGKRISLRKLSQLAGLDRRTIVARWRRAIARAHPDLAEAHRVVIERRGFPLHLGPYLVWMTDYREHDGGPSRMIARLWEVD